MPNGDVNHSIVLFEMCWCNGCNACQREARTNRAIILAQVRIAGEPLFSIL